MLSGGFSRRCCDWIIERKGAMPVPVEMKQT
jgi:hypothetical protein